MRTLPLLALLTACPNTPSGPQIFHLEQASAPLTHGNFGISFYVSNPSIFMHGDVQVAGHFISLDGGATWAIYDVPNWGNPTGSFFLLEERYLVLNTDLHGLMYIDLPEGLAYDIEEPGPLSSVAFDDGRDTLYFGSQEQNVVYRLRDFQWTPIALPASGRANTIAIVDDTLFGVTAQNGGEMFIMPLDTEEPIPGPAVPIQGDYRLSTIFTDPASVELLLVTGRAVYRWDEGWSTVAIGEPSDPLDPSGELATLLEDRTLTACPDGRIVLAEDDGGYSPGLVAPSIEGPYTYLFEDGAYVSDALCDEDGLILARDRSLLRETSDGWRFTGTHPGDARPLPRRLLALDGVFIVNEGVPGRLNEQDARDRGLNARWDGGTDWHAEAAMGAIFQEGGSFRFFRPAPDGGVREYSSRDGANWVEVAPVPADVQEPSIAITGLWEQDGTWTGFWSRWFRGTDPSCSGEYAEYTKSEAWLYQREGDGPWEPVYYGWTACCTRFDSFSGTASTTCENAPDDKGYVEPTVQLRDGRLLAIPSRGATDLRQVMISDDGGRSWSDERTTEGLYFDRVVGIAPDDSLLLVDDPYPVDQDGLYHILRVADGGLGEILPDVLVEGLNQQNAAVVGIDERGALLGWAFEHEGQTWPHAMVATDPL